MQSFPSARRTSALVIAGAFLASLAAAPVAAECGDKMTRAAFVAGSEAIGADNAARHRTQGFGNDRYGIMLHPLRGDFPHGGTGTAAVAPTRTAATGTNPQHLQADRPALAWHPLRGDFPYASESVPSSLAAIIR
jgi:hypothetical protein